MHVPVYCVLVWLHTILCTYTMPKIILCTIFSHHLRKMKAVTVIALLAFLLAFLCIASASRFQREAAGCTPPATAIKQILTQCSTVSIT